METLVKIGGNTVQGILSLKINQNLVGISNIEIKLDLFEGLKKFDKIEIYEVENDGDTLVFEGYVSNIIVNLDDLTVQGKDMRDALKYKVLTTDTTYTGKTIKYIIDDILSKWGILTSEIFTCECFLTSTTTRELKQGDDIASIIDDLCKEFAYTWKVANNVIYISNIIGEDKTSSITLIYNPLENQTTNIQNISREMIDEQYNLIIGTNSSGRSLQSSLGDYMPMCKQESFKDGNLTAQTLAYLNNVKDELQILKIEIKDINVNIGDKIGIIIENTNNYLNFSGNGYIISLETIYGNGDKTQNISVSQLYTKKQDFITNIQQINDNLKLLNIR